MWLSLPVEQVFPVYPATQSQRKSFTSSVQFPPFWQGPSSQSSTSEIQQRGDFDRFMQRFYNEPRAVLRHSSKVKITVVNPTKTVTKQRIVDTRKEQVMRTRNI